MASYTLPNIVTGGSVTVSGNNLQQAQQAAASQTGVSLSAQQGGGTFGSNSNSSDPQLNGGSSSSGGTSNNNGNSNAAALAQQQLSQALASGNAAAAAEAAKEFAQTFGLDQNKFAEAVKEYNQNYGLAQTAQTLASTKQAADIAAQAAGISGMFNGVPTEAAREFNTTSAETALNDRNTTGLGVLNLAASLHSDPFRQLNVMYGANQNSGLQNAVAGITGQYGLAPTAQFTSGGGLDANGFPNNSANMAGITGAFNSPQANGQYTPQQQALATGLNSTNQVIARNYNAAPQNVKDMATSALSMNTGQDQTDINAQIQKNLPQFNAPSFGLATV